MAVMRLNAPDSTQHKWSALSLSNGHLGVDTLIGPDGQVHLMAMGHHFTTFWFLHLD